MCHRLPPLPQLTTKSWLKKLHRINWLKLRGLRIPVATAVGMVAEGMVHEEILKAYPDLGPEDLQETLYFAAEAVRERELPLAS